RGRNQKLFQITKCLFNFERIRYLQLRGGDVSVKQMDQLAVSLRPACDAGDHGHSQFSGKGGNVDFQTAFFGDIHHVQTQNERHPHFEELNGKVEISFEIGSIHDVDQVRIFVDQVCDRQLLLQRLGGQAVNRSEARRVG